MNNKIEAQKELEISLKDMQQLKDDELKMVTGGGATGGHQQIIPADTNGDGYVSPGEGQINPCYQMR